MEKHISHYLVILSLFVLGLSSPILADAATISLSPSSGTYDIGDTFNVDIFLNTESVGTDGADIHFLNFPSSLEVQDAEPATPSTIEISAGTLYGNTVKNLADNTARTIDFSQTTVGGVQYTGSGILATITFKVLSSGTANVDFDFTPGLTNDTNVASDGNDILLTGDVTNGSYTLSPGTLFVSLEAATDGSTWQTSLSGVAPLNGVDLKADVTGTAIGDIHYYFWCDCNSSCSTVSSCQTACGAETYDLVTSNDPYTTLNLCNYTSAGIYTAKVLVERSTAIPDEDRITITVIDPPTLFVDLKVATDGATWDDSLSEYILVNGVDLRGDVSGTATGTINYRFWCDCNSTCNTVSGCTTACGAPSHQSPATNDDPYTILDLCDYSAAPTNTYVVKVVAERGGGGLSNEGRANITAECRKTDLNCDAYINSIDYSSLVMDWGNVIAGTATDFNDDLIVNSVDWSLMNKNWTG